MEAFSRAGLPGGGVICFAINPIPSRTVVAS